MKVIKVIDFTKMLTVKKLDKETKKEKEIQVPSTYYLLSYSINIGDYEKQLSVLIKPVFNDGYDDLEKISVKRMITFNKETGKRQVQDFFKVEK